MNEERLRILKMIEEGKVTADDGAKLLAALEVSKPKLPAERAEWLRIRVKDLDTGKPKVNVNLPLSLLQVAMKFIPEGAINAGGQKIDIEEILASIKAGATGPIVDVQDDEENVHVQILLE